MVEVVRAAEAGSRSVKKVVFQTDQSTDWTWLLKIPVAAGEPIPMEMMFLWHANTLIPFLRSLKQQESAA